MAFIHLQVRSGYSMMNSTVKISELVAQAKQEEMCAVALTDENVMHGAVAFYQHCIKHAIKPLIGMVLTVEDDLEKKINVIALAKNNLGYQQLNKLSTYIQTENKGSITKDALVHHCDQLILILPIENEPVKLLCESDDLIGLNTYANSWRECGANLYFGVKPAEQDKVAFLQQANIDLVAIGDVRYLNKDDHAAYDCLQAMAENKQWEPESSTRKQSNNYFMTQKEAQTAFQDYPHLVEQTKVISDLCHVELDLEQQRLPKYPLQSDRTASSYLRQICQEAMKVKYPKQRPEIEERLNYELNIIEKMHFSDYFLIVWDFVQFAKNQNILVGPGRGSAAGSIVAYLLGITEVDPIKYKLLFERFLNPERISMPDIDIDFSDHRRDEVIDYVKRKYGFDHVAQIGTFGTFQTRSLIRELAKTMGVSAEDTTFMLKEMPSKGSKSIVDSLKRSKTLLDYVLKSAKLQQLFKIARSLEGLPRHVSTHAAGVVISEQPLVQTVPLTKSQQDIYLTQFAMKDIESVGLLKIDFLGLRNLTTIERIVNAIEQKTNKPLCINAIPLDDQETFSILKQGKTNGVFQLESPGMKRVLTQLEPNNLEDIVAVNALYRPGPMGFIDSYVKRKHGQEEVSYTHDDLKPILQPTYGVLIYQEQIIQIANRLAGFTYGQADILRRAVSKKNSEEIKSLRDKFISGCCENGYAKSVALELFEWITRFSHYGFNRSHAVAYSLISYQLAYLKAHFPAYFFTELLNAVIGQKDKTHDYIKEVKDNAIKLLPPSINHSYGHFIVEKNHIRMGLWSIKGIGQPIVKEILQVRKKGRFKDLFDFCLRVSLKIVNRSAIEALILAGAFDEGNVHRASLLATVDQAMEQGELFGDFEDQDSLFGNDIQLQGDYQRVEPYSTIQQLSYEKEYLGLYVSDHPLTNSRSNLRANGYLSIGRLLEMVGRKKQKTVGIIQKINVIRTKRGDQMAFLTVSDEEEELDVVIFPDLFRTVKIWLKEELLVELLGKVEDRNNKQQMVVDQLTPFDFDQLTSLEEGKRLFIRIDEKMENKDFVKQIKKIADRYPGATPVLIYQEKKNKTYQLMSDYNLQITRECLKALNDYFGKSNVVVKNM